MSCARGTFWCWFQDKGRGHCSCGCGWLKGRYTDTWPAGTFLTPASDSIYIRKPYFHIVTVSWVSFSLCLCSFFFLISFSQNRDQLNKHILVSKLFQISDLALKEIKNTKDFTVFFTPIHKYMDTNTHSHTEVY